VFQKFTFGLGHGYSSTPLYAGLTSYLYPRRDAIRWPWWCSLAFAGGDYGSWR